jgi:hypothetical protein
VGSIAEFELDRGDSVRLPHSARRLP